MIANIENKFANAADRVAKQDIVDVFELAIDQDTGDIFRRTTSGWVPMAGNGAANAPLSFRKNDTGTYTYFGDAVPGSATSAAVWRISRMTNADSTILYADGNANFDNVWDNRASLSYS